MSLKCYSLPTDRSLQAFKAWMQSYSFYQNAEEAIQTRQWFNEKDWVENWKKFWAKVDRVSRSQRPDEH